MIDPERAVHCAACRAAIAPGQPVYTLRVELFAESRAPEFDDADLVSNTAADWDRLLAQMAAMSPDEVTEEEAKVHERYEFRLCGACRAKYHDQLKNLASGS